MQEGHTYRVIVSTPSGRIHSGIGVFVRFKYTEHKGDFAVLRDDTGAEVIIPKSSVDQVVVHEIL
jgi:hypothetical protein